MTARTARGVNPFAACKPFTAARNQRVRLVAVRMVVAIGAALYALAQGVDWRVVGVPFGVYLVLVEVRSLNRDTGTLTAHRGRYGCQCGDHR